MRIKMVTGPYEAMMRRDEVERFDMLMDCRWIRNTADLRYLQDEDGRNPFVQAQVEQDGGELLLGWFEEAEERVEKAAAKGDDLYRIGCFCTYGMHRSVAVGSVLCNRLRGDGYVVEIEYMPCDDGIWEYTTTLSTEEVDTHIYCPDEDGRCQKGWAEWNCPKIGDEGLDSPHPRD